MMVVDIISGDARHIPFPDRYFHCAVTSPPYWGLRDYGLGSDSLGLETTPELYVEHLVKIFREVKRVLRDDGTFWLNLGDSYAGSQKGMGADGTAYGGPKQRTNTGSIGLPVVKSKRLPRGSGRWSPKDDICPPGLKPKDLVGIPWMVAFALRADGWYLRSDIIWHKPNPMPESVRDRPTKAHEYLFLLSKAKRYYYDSEAIREPAQDWGTRKREEGEYFTEGVMPTGAPHKGLKDGNNAKTGRNKRSVWKIPPQPYPGAHFAVFPEKLVEPCILAGCPEGGIVLDPFSGSGTVGVVAQRLGRSATLIDAKPEYCKLARERIK